jgi:acyl-CoA synthetase (NDP forming)
MPKTPPQELIQKFQPIFYPKSIAVVGVSKNVFKVGSLWFKAILDMGFTGPLYPVNPHGGELLGHKVYPNLRSIPGKVDYTVVSIPRDKVPELLDDATAKGVKAVHFFTAGFSEASDAYGLELENNLVEKARKGGFRVVGINCLGAHSIEGGLPYGPAGRKGKLGSVSFITQSGGIGEKLTELGTARSIYFNKGISFGNGIDLDGPDYLEYLAVDPKTEIIGAYFEGTRNGNQLVEAITEAARAKPLVVWKAGRTDVGAAAAKSHTGSLAASPAVWSALIKQAGAVEVHNIEDLSDALLIFQMLHRPQGKLHGSGIAVIGGMADGGGGISVSGSDACADAGLNIPSLTKETRDKLAEVIGQVGSILRNPVDVSQTGSNPARIRQAVEIVLDDSNIDLLLVQQDIGVLLRYLPFEAAQTVNNIFIDLKNKQHKPLVLVLPPGTHETERIQLEQELAQASIPVFPSMERAARAINHFTQYWQRRSATGG